MRIRLTNGDDGTLMEPVRGSDVAERIDALAGNDRVDGGAGNDTIYGGAGDDWLQCGQGDDVLEGGAGDDTLGAGSGYDTLRGGAGHDQLNGESASSAVLDGGTGNDTISGSGGGDYMRGGGGADVLGGQGGHDRMFGDAGADTLNGLNGNDTLTGGHGADTFDFLTVVAAGTSVYSGGTDLVMDFDPAHDTLQFTYTNSFHGTVTTEKLGIADFDSNGDGVVDGDDAHVDTVEMWTDAGIADSLVVDWAGAFGRSNGLAILYGVTEIEV